MTEAHVPIEAFDIAGLAPGESFQGFLDIDCSPAGIASLPSRAARGRGPGRTLFIVAGVHGNEYEGMDAIRRVWSALDPDRVRGALATILVANPFAYQSRSRASPPRIDGKNLARVFPGSASGSPTERLAAGLLDLVERNVGTEDLFLDLHSGTAEVAFATMAGFRDIQNPARERSEEAARHMGLPRLWAIPESRGPFNAETARRGIPTIGTEITGRAGCRLDDVEHYERGLWNVLRYLEIITGGPAPIRDDRPARRTVDVHSPASGFVRNPGRLRQIVSAHDVIGVIIDPFGEVISEIRSPVGGEIWAAIESPVVETGDLLFMIAGDESVR